MKQLWQDVCINCIHKDENCYVFEFPCLDYEPRERVVKRMTREKAIFTLMNSNEYHHAKGDMPHSASSVEAFNMAIEALKEMPVEEYRQRLMEVFHRTDHDELLAYVVMPKEEEFKSLEDILRQNKFEPRPHGEWISKNEKRYCSNCKKMAIYVPSMYGPRALLTDFCPYCGADMRPKEGEKE